MYSSFTLVPESVLTTDVNQKLSENLQLQTTLFAQGVDEVTSWAQQNLGLVFQSLSFATLFAAPGLSNVTTDCLTICGSGLGNGVCDANTGLYGDPREAICVTAQCAYDGGDCINAGSAASTTGLNSIGYTVGYVGGSQYNTVTQPTVLPTWAPPAPSPGQTLTTSGVLSVLGTQLSTTISRFATFFNWNQLYMYVQNTTALSSFMANDGGTTTGQMGINTGGYNTNCDCTQDWSCQQPVFAGTCFLFDEQARAPRFCPLARCLPASFPEAMSLPL